MCRAGRWLWTGGLRALGGCRQELAAGLCALGLLKGFLGQHVVLGQAEGRLGTYAVMGESRLAWCWYPAAPAGPWSCPWSLPEGRSPPFSVWGFAECCVSTFLGEGSPRLRGEEALC